MAATTAFPSLSVSAPEDTMEMSSPAHLPGDDDIDLDFGGDYDGGVHVQDDEQMLTDGEQPWPPTATDATMDDDMPVVMPMVEEAQMQVEPAQEDDELIDYDDEYYNQPQPEDTVVEDPGLQWAEEAIEPADEEVIPQAESTAAVEDASFLERAGPAPSEHTAVIQHAINERTTQTDAPAALESAEEHEEYEQVGAQYAETTEEAVVDEAAEGVEQPANGDPSFNVQTPAENDVAATAEAPGTPTDTGLHPMTLFYNGLELPLFKSKRQQDGLLKDDNLASVSLAELLSNCRQRLATKLGRNVPGGQDLVLTFDDLGLTLVEHSRCTFQSSLNDVLEVYLLLYQNDGVHDVPPLSLTLTQQFKFSSNLTLLKQRAEDGDGIPRLAVHETHEVNAQDYYTEDLQELGESDAAALDDEHGLEEPYDEQAAHEDQSHAVAEHEHGGDYDEAYHGLTEDAPGYPEDEEQYHDEHAHYASGPGEEEHDSYEATQPVAPQDDGQALESIALGDDHGEHRDHVTQADDQPQLLSEEIASTQEILGDPENAAFTTSSQTVRGDTAAPIVGECDQDAIDWDDDSDLTSKSLEREANAQDKLPFGSVAEDAEPALEEPKETASSHRSTGGKADHSAEADLDAFRDRDENATVDGQESQPADAPGSENFLEEFDAQDVEGTTFVADDGEHDDQEAQDYTQHEDQFYQADISDEQQERGEDTEPALTIDDPLEAQNYEHGLEHNANGDDYGAEEEQPAHDDTYHYDGEDQLDPEDDLIFDDETTEQHEARRKASQPELAAVGSDSPLGKRSFEELAETDDLFDDEPELKKVRSQ